MSKCYFSFLSLHPCWKCCVRFQQKRERPGPEFFGHLIKYLGNLGGELLYPSQLGNQEQKSLLPGTSLNPEKSVHGLEMKRVTGKTVDRVGWMKHDAAPTDDPRRLSDRRFR